MRAPPEPTLDDFRTAVRAVIARDLEREAEAAAALRADLVPKVERVVAEARVAGLCGRAWIFGSFAWGSPCEASDVDLLVERCADPFRLASLVAGACGREAHVVDLETAPAGLRDRVIAEGLQV